MTVVGIDLGTTYSVIAHVDSIREPRTIPNSEGDSTTPSAVLFDRNSVIVGKEAIKAAGFEYDKVARFVKREMGNEFYSKKFAGEFWRPEMIQSFVLRRLKDDAEKIIGPIDGAVITVPAYFNDLRRMKTQEAGKLAGLNVMDIINEPTAAALAYFNNKKFQNQELILVFDLGGGTFDVTLVKAAIEDSGATRFQTIATDGRATLGGYDWDMAIVDRAAREYMKSNRNVDPRLNPALFEKMLTEAESAKRSLSRRDEVNFVIDNFRTVITRAQFEQDTAALVQETRGLTEAVISNAEIRWNQITTVLLVGGSSRMPMIYKMLEEATGRKPDAPISVDEVVALGAALYANVIQEQKLGRAPSIIVENVNAHSLGVLVNNRRTGLKEISVIINSNQRIPAEAARKYRVHGTGQNLKLRIFEGDNPADKGGCIGTLSLQPKLPFQQGEEVEIGFRYLASGRLSIGILRVNTGEKWKEDLER